MALVPSGVGVIALIGMDAIGQYRRPDLCIDTQLHGECGWKNYIGKDMLYYCMSIPMPANRLTPMPPPINRRSLLDRLGATGSLLCAIHCALLPLLITLLPSLGIAVWLGEGFEQGFVLFATVLGAVSMIGAYRRHHVVRALGLLLPGLAVLWFSVLYRPLHHSLVPHAITMTLGGTLVGLAHLANLRLNHASNTQASNKHGHIHNATAVH